MIKAAALTWALITVTNGAAVHQEPGFSSKALCEDARSIALYGKTVAEEKKAVEAADAARKQREDAWRKAHPPRGPKTEEEKWEVKHTTSWSSTDGRCGHSKDGLIYEDECMTYTGFSVDLNSDYHNNQIKYSECVMVEPDAP